MDENLSLFNSLSEAMDGNSSFFAFGDMHTIVVEIQDSFQYTQGRSHWCFLLRTGGEGCGPRLRQQGFSDPAQFTEEGGRAMKAKEEMQAALRNLGIDRMAIPLIREDIAGIEKDMKKGLPAAKREALEEERTRLLSSLLATEHSISRIERLLFLLSPEEQEVLDRTLINPCPEAVFDLAREYNCETTRIYRIRARALYKLTRLRYGASA